MGIVFTCKDSEKYSKCENYVCNVGSGITPDIDPNKVGLFLQRLRVLNSK